MAAVPTAAARAFPVEIERPWESFISKISSLTLCSMTISSYVLFISPPIYIGLSHSSDHLCTPLYLGKNAKTFWNVFFHLTLRILRSQFSILIVWDSNLGIFKCVQTLAGLFFSLNNSCLPLDSIMVNFPSSSSCWHFLLSRLQKVVTTIENCFFFVLLHVYLFGVVFAGVSVLWSIWKTKEKAWIFPYHCFLTVFWLLFSLFVKWCGIVPEDLPRPFKVKHYNIKSIA